MVTDLRIIRGIGTVRFLGIVDGKWKVFDIYLVECDGRYEVRVGKDINLGLIENVPDSPKKLDKIIPGDIQNYPSVEVREVIRYSDLDDIKMILGLDDIKARLKKSNYLVGADLIVGKLADLGYDSISYTVEGNVSGSSVQKLVIDCILINVDEDVTYDDIKKHGIEYKIKQIKQRVTFKYGFNGDSESEYVIYIN